MNPEISGAVLAGGTSSRFGSDKAAFAVAGKPLVRWVAERLARWCGEVIVVRAPGSEPWPFVLPAGIRLVFDPVLHLGPLAGLAQALEEARNEWVLAAACDSPLLQDAVIARLCELREGADAVAGELDGRVQPFPALYRREPALRAFRTALAAGERSVRGALRNVRLRLLPEAELRQLDPALLTYRNANTPDAAAALEELLLRSGSTA